MDQAASFICSVWIGVGLGTLFTYIQLRHFH